MMAETPPYIDYKKTRELVHSVNSMYRGGRFPFNTPNLFPDAAVPRNIEPGSEEHGRYIFHSVSIDSRLRADVVYEAMDALVSSMGEQGLRGLTKVWDAKLLAVLGPYIGNDLLNPLKNSDSPVRTLKYNARRLEKNYDGDARLIYSGFGNKRIGNRTSVKKTMKRLGDFRQYGIAKPALAIKNMVRAGIWNFSEHNIPVKVDRHLLRIALGTGALIAERCLEDRAWDKRLPKSLEKARDLMIRNGYLTPEDFERGDVRVAKFDNRKVGAFTETIWDITLNDKISAINLDDAFWAIGSKNCVKNDLVNCASRCSVGCDTRPPSNNDANWFFVDIDHRKGQDDLLSKIL